MELLQAVSDGTIEEKLTAVGTWDCGPCGIHYKAGKSLVKHEGSDWHLKYVLLTLNIASCGHASQANSVAG